MTLTTRTLFSHFNLNEVLYYATRLDKNSTTYRVVKTIRVDGKNKTLPIKTFGSDRYICETYGVTDAKAWAKEQVKLMNEAELEESISFNIELNPSLELPLNTQTRFNGGYLFLQDIYYELGLDKICHAIAGRHSYNYDLNNIFSRLIYTRILFPSSKKNSFEESKRFIEQPSFELHDIYRALSVIAEESDYIQSRLFKNSSELSERKTGVIYYDCTNFYFEIEQAEDDKQYGVSKENRPLRSIRNSQITRAEKMIKNGNASISKKKPNDPKRFIKTNHATKEGEVAAIADSYIDLSRIADEEKYDGFYAVCTNLDDSPESIVAVNKRRWEIEECFRIMKTDFEARPVYVKRQERILAHFITCFIALIIYRYLEKRLDNQYSIDQILSTLREMDFIRYEGKGYQPIYTRTKLTDDLHNAFNFCTSKQIIPTKKMRNICSQTKK